MSSFNLYLENLYEKFHLILTGKTSQSTKILEYYR